MLWWDSACTAHECEEPKRERGRKEKTKEKRARLSVPYCHTALPTDLYS